MPSSGYAGHILRIDLSTGGTRALLTADYADLFLGGRGIAGRLYWDEVPPETKAFDPANLLVFMTGPVAGFMGFSGCRWEVCGKSPLMEPEHFSYANLGGSWGAYLKYAGLDGLAISGKADRPVYLLFNDGRVELRSAAHLWGKTTVETEDALHAELGEGTRVLSIGRAGENQVTFATMLAAGNASGSSGFGAVMGSKNLKAIAVRADGRKPPLAADPDSLKQLAALTRRLRTTNFEDYGHILPGTMKLAACYGCISGCTRARYRAEDGHDYKSLCQAAGVYIGPATRYYGRGQGTAANLLAGRLCDAYGLDTVVLSLLIGWLGECFRAGILSETETGLPLSKIGSTEFIETLARKLADREGFGDVLAQGIPRAARLVGRNADRLPLVQSLTRSGESVDYDPRVILANSLGYATEPRRAVHIHHGSVLPLNRWLNWTQQKWPDAGMTFDVLGGIAEKCWGSRDALDFSSPDGKALMAKRMQDYAYLKESLVLCDLAWPIWQVRDILPEIGPYTIESRIVNAIIGRRTDEANLAQTGERIYNLQRAILMREGWGGRAGDILPDSLFTTPIKGLFYDPECITPGPNGERISRKGAVLDRSVFERLKNEFYALRGWDVATGRQTRPKLVELGLGDIVDDLEHRGLLYHCDSAPGV